MATAVLERLEQLNPNTDSITEYMEHVSIFFTINVVPDGKKATVFLNMVGGKTYSLLCSLLAPALPQDTSYAALVDTLKLHCEPKPLVIV